MRGGKLGPYGDEVGVPIIDGDSWNKLSAWLEDYSTAEPDHDVLNTFQEQTGHTITFWRENGM